jgi:hypothetical protein
MEEHPDRASGHANRHQEPDDVILYVDYRSASDFVGESSEGEPKPEVIAGRLLEKCPVLRHWRQSRRHPRQNPAQAQILAGDGISEKPRANG